MQSLTIFGILGFTFFLALNHLFFQRIHFWKTEVNSLQDHYKGIKDTMRKHQLWLPQNVLPGPSQINSAKESPIQMRLHKASELGQD